jgi:hypothetical protein
MPSATSYVGTGTVSSSADVVAGVERALAAKYGWQFKTTQFADWLRDRFSRGNRQEPVAVQLSLEVG